MQLVKYGTIQLIKEGVVFTLLITGTGLSNWATVNEIMKLVTDYTKDKYPNIEAMRNDDSFYCLILKAKD